MGFDAVFGVLHCQGFGCAEVGVVYVAKRGIKEFSLTEASAKSLLAHVAELRADMRNLNVAGSYGEWRTKKMDLDEALDRLVEWVDD